MVDVQLTGLVKKYGANFAVDHVDLTIPGGAFVTLLGPSGCGKTTTLRSIAGLEEPDGGQIRIGDRVVVDVERGRFVQPERRKVGMVFQSYALWPHMTVAQNVAYPLRRQKRARAEAGTEIDHMLELVNLRSQRDRSVAALSGGQQQRVALARAMVGDPVLTLFDEPLSNLDVKLRVRMRTEIRRLHDRVGMTSVYVTHDQEEALALSDVVVVMNDGRVQQVGSPQDIYLRPANGFVADFVGYENSLPVGLVSGAAGAARVRLPDGQEFEMATDAAAGKGTLYARPASIGFTARPQSVRVASGRVLSVTYLGSSWEYQVDTADGLIVGREPAAAVGISAAFSTGDVVPVYLDPTTAVALAHTSTPGSAAPHER